VEGIIPSCQRRGYGRYLLRVVLTCIKQTGYQVMLDVERHNAAAIALYIKAGFKNLGEYDCYIIRDVSAIDDGSE